MEIHRKVQDLSRGFQHGDHDIVVEKVEAANSRIAAYEASSRNLQQVIEDIRRQVRSLPSSNEQTQSVIRRELASYRNSLDATMRRVTTVESNVHTLNGMNNRIMAQLADIEGNVDDAADMIQVAQQNPRGPRERQNVGYNAFAGQGHRIRSPTPFSGDGHGRDTDLSIRPGGGVSLTDHTLPNAPVRVDASHADRRPIPPVRERADSRSRRALGLPDRSHPPGAHEGWSLGACQGGCFNFPEQEPKTYWLGIGNQGEEGRSAIAGVFLRTQAVHLEAIGVAGLKPTSRVPAIAGGLLGAGLMPTPRVPARAGGFLRPRPIAGRLRDQLQEACLADLAYRRSEIRTIQMTGSTRTQSSLVPHASVNSVGCARVTMGIVGIVSS